ncbi:hypothetical protein [Cupriavidus metallidurans]|nr:hypothetical protein [Cupriavidus metallidurans]
MSSVESAEALANLLYGMIATNKPVFKTSGPVTLMTTGKFDSRVVPRALGGAEELWLNGFTVNESGFLVALLTPTMKASPSIFKAIGRIHVVVDPRTKGEKQSAQMLVTDVQEEEKLMDGGVTVQGTRRLNLLEWIDEQLASKDDELGNSLAEFAEKLATAEVHAREEALKGDARFGSW